MRPKTLSRHEELDIERAFHEVFQRSKKLKSFPQMWFEAVMTWLEWKFEGSSIIARSVRDMETKVLQHDALCKEYVSALMKVCLPDSFDQRELSEHQKVVLMMMASSDEREEALLLIQS